MTPAVAELLHNPLLWRGEALARVERATGSGFAALDRELPGGGWPQGTLTELLVDNEGIGELRLLLPALAGISRGGGWIALVAPPHLPYGPALARADIEPRRVVVVEAGEGKDRWWAAEQILRADSAGALLFWPQSINDARLRRLAVAAQDTHAIAFLFARTERAAMPSPAALRIRLSSAAEKLRVDVFKRRGGVSAQPLYLDVAAAMQDDVRRGRGEATPPSGSTDARPFIVRLRQRPRRLSPSFNRHYPVGMPPARIWNRALVRADGVGRMPGPDPRGKPRRYAGCGDADFAETRCSFVVPAEAGTQ